MKLENYRKMEIPLKEKVGIIMNDPEHSQEVNQVLYAASATNKAFKIIGEYISGKIEIVAVYPGEGDRKPKKGVYIGEIIDGQLWSSKK